MPVFRGKKAPSSRVHRIISYDDQQSEDASMNIDEDRDNVTAAASNTSNVLDPANITAGSSNTSFEVEMHDTSQTLDHSS